MSIKSDIIKFVKYLDNLTNYLIKAETSLTGKELCQIHEIVFLKAFREFECTTENIFINAMCRNETLGAGRLNSFIKAKDYSHALDLLCLEKPYLDWDSPTNVIKRAEIIFANNSLISDYYKLKNEHLLQARKIRNYIAHSSKEAERQFSNVYKHFFGTLPVTTIEPGDFLKLNVPKITHSLSFTNYYINIFKDISSII